jgi:hypothetical protein
MFCFPIACWRCCTLKMKKEIFKVSCPACGQIESSVIETQEAYVDYLYDFELGKMTTWKREMRIQRNTIAHIAAIPLTPRRRKGLLPPLATNHHRHET